MDPGPAAHHAATAARCAASGERIPLLEDGRACNRALDVLMVRDTRAALLTMTERLNKMTARGGQTLLVAIDFFAFLVALLRLHRERRDRARLQPLQRDRLAGLLAIAGGVVLDALQRGVDLGDQLALTVAGAQLDRPVGLRRGAVGEVGVIDVLFLQGLQRHPRFPEDLVLPRQQLGAKIIALAVVHERLFFGGSIILQLFQGQPIYTFWCLYPNPVISCGILLHELRRQRRTNKFKLPVPLRYLKL